MSDFWDTIDRQLDHLERDRPTTAAQVIAILNQYSTPSAGQAFFAGSGGDRQLMDAMFNTGWRIARPSPHYYWVMIHPETDDKITYIEGDVYAGDQMTT